MSDRRQRVLERRAAMGDREAQLHLDAQAVREKRFPLYYPTARIKRVVQALLSQKEIRRLAPQADLRDRYAWLDLVAYLQEDPPRDRSGLLKRGYDPGTIFAAKWLDEDRIGTPLYGGVAYFWNHEYRHTLREVPQLARKAIHDTWLNHGLDLNGESPEHEQLMRAVLRTPEGWEWVGGDQYRVRVPGSDIRAQHAMRSGGRWRPPDPLPNPPRLTKDQWDRLVADLLDHELSIGQAAEKYGVSQQAISAQLKKRPYAHRIYRASDHAHGRREKKWEQNGDPRRCSICGNWKHGGHCRQATYSGIDAADARAWNAELRAEADPFWYPRSLSEDDQAEYGHKLDRGFDLMKSSEDELEDHGRSWAARGYQVRRRPNPPEAVVLVSCSNDKIKTGGKKVQAQDLYMKSDWFRKARSWAEKQGHPWAILSAKHGLVMPTTKIATYNKWLAKESVAKQRAWAQKTAAELTAKFGADVHYVVLAGRPYRRVFDYMPGTSYEVPMEGMGIGLQKKWLKTHLNPDEDIRRLQRQAGQGDREAYARWINELLRRDVLTGPLVDRPAQWRFTSEWIDQAIAPLVARAVRWFDEETAAGFTRGWSGNWDLVRTEESDEYADLMDLVESELGPASHMIEPYHQERPSNATDRVQDRIHQRMYDLFHAARPPHERNPKRRRRKKPKISYEDTGETAWERFLNSIPLAERQRIDQLPLPERRDALDRKWWEWVEARKGRRGEQPGQLFNPRRSSE